MISLLPCYMVHYNFYYIFLKYAKPSFLMHLSLRKADLVIKVSAMFATWKIVKNLIYESVVEDLLVHP